MQPFFSRLGGKNKLKKHLISLFPEHAIYVEPFIGAGSIFLYKKEAEINVINDLDKDIYHLWVDTRDVKPEIITDFDLSADRNKFENFKVKTFKNKNKRLYRNLYLSSCSFSSNRRNYFDGKKLLIKYKKNITKYQDKLKNTIILNLPFEKVIKKYDSVSTFFYLDPPYHYSKKVRHYKHQTVNPYDVLNVCKKIKGKFLLSYNDTPKIREIFKDFYISETAKIRYSILNKGKLHYVTELLISNYKLN